MKALGLLYLGLNVLRPPSYTVVMKDISQLMSKIAVSLASRSDIPDFQIDVDGPSGGQNVTRQHNDDCFLLRMSILCSGIDQTPLSSF